MPSIYDVLAESCAALAARTGRTSDKVRLLHLADQWRTILADRQGPCRPPSIPARLAEPVQVPARLAPKSRGPNEIKSKWAKEDALVKVRNAIGVLRGLGIDDDRILGQLGFGAERKHRGGTG
jgi:hypothetical protein